MSLISSAASTAASLPTINFKGHGGHHRKGGSTDNATAQAQSSTQGLLSQLFETLGAVTGLPISALTGGATPSTTATSAVNGTGAAAGATAAGATTAAATAATAAAGTTSAGAAQSVQSFLHALFQALKADGLGPAGTSSAATAAGSAAASTGSAGATESGAGRYAGSLVSSLETLIQQVGGTGATSATAANLSASFNNLIANVGGTTAASGNGTSPTSTASLQSFLSGLLQDARNGGGPSRSSLGATVNANV